MTGGSFWGVIDSKPLDIDYHLIYKGFNDTMNGQAEGAIINLLIGALVCWGLWSLMRWMFKREETRKLEQWSKLETMKPDYQGSGGGGGGGAQKRLFMRIEVQAGFSFWLLDPQGKVVGEEISEKLLDLSAGGLSFCTNEILDTDKHIHMQLDLGKPPLIKVTGRVARVQFSPEGEEKRYMIGIQFLGIRVGEQDRIIKHTLNSQRKVIEEKKRKAETCATCGQPLPFDDRGEPGKCLHCAADEAAAANDPNVLS